MKRHLTNATYGVLDYVSYPLGMLLVAPVILHKLGASEYGLWMIATSIISAGGIIASGFCDAGLQRVAQLRGENPANTLFLRPVCSLLTANLALGCLCTTFVWFAAPYAASHIGIYHSTSQQECLICIRIAAAAVLLRAVESVAVITHRAFEQYHHTVQISVAVRLLTLASAALLALTGHRTVSILTLTVLFLLLGTYMQFRLLRDVIGPQTLRPMFNLHELRILLGSGIFAWLQTLGGVVFGQFDRILLGVSMGAAAVAPYALCVQFAQPIYGLTASGLHFLFPYLSVRANAVPAAALRRTLWKAFACNLLLVFGGAGLLLLFGNRVIRIWADAAVASSAEAIFRPIVFGSAFMGLSVSGIYAMQALGLFRLVALITLSGRAVMLVLMMYLLKHLGLQGLAISRLFYGSVALLVYVPLLRGSNFGKRGSLSRDKHVLSSDVQNGVAP